MKKLLNTTFEEIMHSGAVEFCEGQIAFIYEKLDNPYPPGTQSFEAWNAGWANMEDAEKDAQQFKDALTDLTGPDDAY